MPADVYSISQSDARNMNIWAFVSLIVVSRAALQIEVSPSTVQLGVTKDLQVRCAFTAGKTPAITGLFYLLISHANTTEDPDFQHLALFNLLDGKINLFSRDVASANGYINTRGESFITVAWRDPTSRTSGVYRCEANGVDFIGRPRVISETTAVKAVSPGAEVFLREVEELKGHVANLERTVRELREQTAGLKRFQETMETRLRLAVKSLFDESEVFSGRRYYLTNGATSFVPSTGEAACAMVGGYLAEVDSQDEFRFLSDFIGGRSGNLSVIMTGATDEQVEGRWTGRHSQAVLEVSNWAEGEPDEGANGNCQGFSRDVDWYLVDTSCVQQSSTNDVGYVCEMEEQVHNEK